METVSNSFSIPQLVSLGVGSGTHFNSKGWSPSHSAILSPILHELEVNQEKRTVGRGYGAGGSARVEHKGGRYEEVCEEVQGRQGDWGCRCRESVRQGPGRSCQTLALPKRTTLEGSKQEWTWSHLNSEMVTLAVL